MGNHVNGTTNRVYLEVGDQTISIEVLSIVYSFVEMESDIDL